MNTHTISHPIRGEFRKCARTALHLIPSACVIVLVGCQTNSQRPTPSVNFGAIVNTLDTGEYHLQFNGYASLSVDEARERWQEEALTLCGTGQAVTDITRAETDTYTSTVSTASAISSVSDTTANVTCQLGGLIGCGLLMLLVSPGEQTTEVEDPVIEGTVSRRD